MSGELNGTNVLLYRLDNNSDRVALMGQLEITRASTGNPIDISNKHYGDFVTLLDRKLSSKQITISGGIIYNGDAAFQQLRLDRLSGETKEYLLDYGGDKEVIFNAIPSDMADSLPQGSAVQTSFTMVSTGALGQQVDLISNDGFNLVSSDGFTLTAKVYYGS